MGIKRKSSGQNARPLHFTRFNSVAQSNGVWQIRASVHYRSKSIARQHLFQLLVELGSRKGRRSLPLRLHEVDMTVPKAGNDCLAGTVYCGETRRNVDATSRTSSDDLSMLD